MFGSSAFAVPMLEALAKSVDAGVVADTVPQDLETEAHLTLWHDSDPGELTLLKLCPGTTAKAIEHKYDQFTSYETNRRVSSFVGERSLPAESRWQVRQLTTLCKLMARTSPVFILASLQKTITVDGQQGAEAITEASLRLDMLRDKNRLGYFSRNDTHKDGVQSVRFKGLIQQIEEGTNGTDGRPSPYGSHIVDMKGKPLTLQFLREYAKRVMILFGRARVMIMSYDTRQDLETSIDGDRLVPMPNSMKPYLLGGSIAGFQTQGHVVFFETDNVLTPEYAWGKYVDTLTEGAPTGRPTVGTPTIGAPPSGVTSNWDADTTLDVYWIFTETKDELESLGTRKPATGTSSVAVGQIATFSVTPSNPLADSFRVYRGTSEDAADTDAWFLFEVANSGGGAAVTVRDTNDWRPGCSVAFLLSITSKSMDALHNVGSDNALVDNYEHVKANALDFFQMQDNPAKNTVTWAHLGPAMGTMELGNFLMTVRRPVLFSAGTPIVRNAWQNVVFKNIGNLTVA